MLGWGGEARVLLHLEVARPPPSWGLPPPPLWRPVVVRDRLQSVFSKMFLSLSSGELGSRSLGWSVGIFLMNKHPGW